MGGDYNAVEIAKTSKNQSKSLDLMIVKFEKYRRIGKDKCAKLNFKVDKSTGDVFVIEDEPEKITDELKKYLNNRTGKFCIDFKNLFKLLHKNICIHEITNFDISQINEKDKINEDNLQDDYKRCKPFFDIELKISENEKLFQHQTEVQNFIFRVIYYTFANIKDQMLRGYDIRLKFYDSTRVLKNEGTKIFKVSMHVIINGVYVNTNYDVFKVFGKYVNEILKTIRDMLLNQDPENDLNKEFKNLQIEIDPDVYREKYDKEASLRYFMCGKMEEEKNISDVDLGIWKKLEEIQFYLEDKNLKFRIVPYDFKFKFDKSNPEYRDEKINKLRRLQDASVTFISVRDQFYEESLNYISEFDQRELIKAEKEKENLFNRLKEENAKLKGLSNEHVTLEKLEWILQHLNPLRFHNYGSFEVRTESGEKKLTGWCYIVFAVAATNKIDNKTNTIRSGPLFDPQEIKDLIYKYSYEHAKEKFTRGIYTEKAVKESIEKLYNEAGVKHGEVPEKYLHYGSLKHWFYEDNQGNTSVINHLNQYENNIKNYTTFDRFDKYTFHDFRNEFEYGIANDNKIFGSWNILKSELDKKAYKVIASIPSEDLTIFKMNCTDKLFKHVVGINSKNSNCFKMKYKNEVKQDDKKKGKGEKVEEVKTYTLFEYIEECTKKFIASDNIHKHYLYSLWLNNVEGVEKVSTKHCTSDEKELYEKIESNEIFFCYIPFVANYITNFNSEAFENSAGGQKIIFFIKNVICGGDEKMYKYYLHTLQVLFRPEWGKTEKCIIHQSRLGGNGKTFITEYIVKFIIGESLTVSLNNVADMADNFNSFMSGCRLMVVDEVFNSEGSVKQICTVLKDVLTSKTKRLIKRKFQEPTKEEISVNIILNTNHAISDILIMDDALSRRVMITEVSSIYAQNKQYFGDLYEEIYSTEFADQFYTYIHDIAKKEENLCLTERAPENKIKMSALRESLDVPVKFMIDVKNGEFDLGCSLVEKKKDGRDVMFISSKDLYQKFLAWYTGEYNNNCKMANQTLTKKICTEHNILESVKINDVRGFILGEPSDDKKVRFANVKIDSKFLD